MIRPSLLAAIAASCLAGEAAPPAESRMPPGAQATAERFAKAAAKLEADYRKALSAERARAISELEKAQKASTKAGDLDGALAIKARLDDLRAAQDADGEGLLPSDRPAAPNTPTEFARQAQGRWSLTKNGGLATLEINPGGLVNVSYGQISIGGTWRVEKDRVVINWGGDQTKWENLGFDGPDRMAGDSFDAGRNGITCVRIKPPPR